VQRVARVLELKRTLGTDSWTYWLPASDITRAIESAGERAATAIGVPELAAKDINPHLKQAALDGFFGALLQPVYAEAFRGLSENELDRVLASFALSQCRRNEPLLGVARKHLVTSAR